MKYIHRNLSDEIIKWLGRREILAIKGPRQSGKTTLLEILKEHLLKKQKVSPSKIIWLNFEDSETLDDFTRGPADFVKSFVQKNRDKFYFFIDEFQYLKNGGRIIKLLYDSYPQIKFIITGSSSLELTGSTARFLVGRVFSFYLYPFSFSEFIQKQPRNLSNFYEQKSGELRDFIFRGKLPKISEDIYSKKFTRLFEKYLTWGGYPEVVKAPDAKTKRIILKNIYDTYITRDIVELLKIEDVSGFRNLILHLSGAMGSLLNYNSLMSDGKIYFRRLKHYLSILEETFVIKQLAPFYSNRITELKKNPKLYFIDTGLRNYIIKNFNLLKERTDSGNLAENFVFSQLCSSDYAESAPGREEIKYWRTIAGAEVDFILRINGKIIPIEVKYSFFRKPEISRGFRSFITKYKPKRALILTRGFWGKMKVDKTNVVFAPVWWIR